MPVANQTAVADVLDALVTIWQADANLATYGTRLQVFDGPPVTNRAAEIEIWVGATGVTPEEEVITASQDTDTFDDSRSEILDVTNAVWVYATTADIKTCRRTAITAFNYAAAAIRATTLGVSGVQRVDVVGWRLREGEYTTGPGVVLTFTIRAWAYL